MLAAKQAVARMHKIFLQLSVHLKSSRKYLSANVVTPTSESLNDTPHAADRLLQEDPFSRRIKSTVCVENC